MNQPKPLTAKEAIRIIRKECLGNIRAFQDSLKGFGPGARGEARGTVATAREMLVTLRGLRKRLTHQPKGRHDRPGTD